MTVSALPLHLVLYQHTYQSELRKDYGPLMEEGIRHAIYLQFSASSFPCSLKTKPPSEHSNTRTGEQRETA